MNGEPIRAPSDPTGNSYEFVDRTVEPGRTYSYRLDAVDTWGNMQVFDLGTVTVGRAPPSSMVLHESRPNPFNPSTLIPFELSRSARVTLRIYDTAGRQVRTLVDGVLGPDLHHTAWDGLDDRGKALGSGVYFCRLSAGGRTFAEKLVMVR
jgi:hypothetical protein